LLVYSVLPHHWFVDLEDIQLVKKLIKYKLLLGTAKAVPKIAFCGPKSPNLYLSSSAKLGVVNIYIVRVFLYMFFCLNSKRIGHRG